MALDGKILRRALERYNADKQRRAEEHEARRRAVYARVPRVAQIDRQLSGTMSQIIARALRRGEDPTEAIREIRDENLALQEEKRSLLMSHGYAPDYLEEKPACVLCGDSGYTKAGMCRCLADYYAREQTAELSRMLDFGAQSFDTFSLDWYSEEVWQSMGRSPRRQMETVYETCVHYARSFRPGSGSSLLMTGAPGLGKTFLSTCIAREVSARGVSVVYDTAASVFAAFEEQKFGREGDGEEAVARTMGCDLLILDDLGTEMTTAFVQSALYQIVNTRLLENKATIINTNLTPQEIAQRYSPQIASRLTGEYQVLVFFGEDIRRKKRQQGGV